MPASPHDSASLPRQGVSPWRGLALWGLLLGFYFLCSGVVSLNEALAGAGACSFAAWFAVGLRAVEVRRQVLLGPWRAVAWVLGALVADVWRVGGVLLGAVWRGGASGVVAHQAFRHGSDNPSDAGRRGLVTLGASLAPNGFVVAIPGDVLVLHRLAAVADKGDREWPV